MRVGPKRTIDDSVLPFRLRSNGSADSQHLHRFDSSQGSDAANRSSSETGISTFAPLRLARMRPAARSRSSSLTERLSRRAASARSTNMPPDAVSLASAGAGTCSARVMAEN
jgi:hypothetical protein